MSRMKRKEARERSMFTLTYDDMIRAYKRLFCDNRSIVVLGKSQSGITNPSYSRNHRESGIRQKGTKMNGETTTHELVVTFDEEHQDNYPASIKLIWETGPSMGMRRADEVRSIMEGCVRQFADWKTKLARTEWDLKEWRKRMANR